MSNREMKIPNNIKKKYGEKFPIWSYSKCSAIDNCVYEYYLNRILKYKSMSNIYSEVGEVVHNILETFYDKKIKYEDMASIFKEKFSNIEMLGYRFYKDTIKNKKFSKAYQDCLINFFKTHKVNPYKIYSEKEVWTEIDNNVFVGYIDVLFQDEEKNTYILDYKTSSISGYIGKKKKEKGMQLLLYALALNQLGFPLHKIKCCWNFLKYVEVTIEEINTKGEMKYKTHIKERNNWIDGIKKFLLKELTICYPNLLEWELDLKIEQCISENSLNSLPKSIQDKVKLNDAIIYIDVNEEEIENLKNYLRNNINEINHRIESQEWDIEPISKNNSFYCVNLCGVKKHCKYYKDYIEKYGETF